MISKTTMKMNKLWDNKKGAPSTGVIALIVIVVIAVGVVLWMTLTTSVSIDVVSAYVEDGTLNGKMTVEVNATLTKASVYNGTHDIEGSINIPVDAKFVAGKATNVGVAFGELPEEGKYKVTFTFKTDDGSTFDKTFKIEFKPV